jgi:CDP-paratose 2-epimerase
MRILVTGICGFVGSQVAAHFKRALEGAEIVGIDNLLRRGSESNLAPLKRLGCAIFHGDLRLGDDLAELPRCDWVIDCAANPSVLAGVSGGTAQLVGHNLVGTLNLLEKCRRDAAGLVILSSSRVYSIDALNAIPLDEAETRFVVAHDGPRPTPAGASARGISERFSTAAPVSLYGGTKLASEVMALEYAAAFGFPVWIDRCGVIAGPGQFGRIDQGIFSYWIYQWLLGAPLKYVGYGGKGLQVRDFVSPGDLVRLLEAQIRNPGAAAPRILNVGGGPERSMSLAELSSFCRENVGPAPPVGAVAETRRYDIPYYVTDAAEAERAWGWTPVEPRDQTLQAIARWARDNRELLPLFS